MTREEMIRLARHCNLGLLVGPLYALLDDEWERLHRFAALAAEWGAKQERAACENLCESLANEDECDEMAYRALRQAAELIRKRGGGRRERF